MKKFVFVLFLMGFVFAAPTSINDCTNINESGTYELNSDTNNPITYAGDKICMVIRTSNVALDCQDNTINAKDMIKGVYIIPPSHKRFSNISIKNCNIKNGNEGINAYRSDNINVDNVKITDSDTAVIFTIVNDSQITNSDFINSDMILQSNSQNNTVMGNGLHGEYAHILLHEQASRNEIIGNRIANTTSPGIHMRRGSTGNLIKNNDIKNAKSGITVGGTFEGVFGTGVFNKLLNNKIISSNQGIVLGSVVGTLVKDNKIIDSQGNGLHVGQFARNSTFIRNEVSGSGNHGLYIRDSDGTTFKNEHYYNNKKDFGTWQHNYEESGKKRTNYFEGVVFGSDGTYYDYANISMTYSSPSTFSMDYNKTGPTPPAGHERYKGQSLVIMQGRPPEGGPTPIESLTFHWKDDTLNNESNISLQRYVNDWKVLNSNPDTQKNQIKISNVDKNFQDQDGFYMPAHFALLYDGEVKREQTRKEQTETKEEEQEKIKEDAGTLDCLNSVCSIFFVLLGLVSMTFIRQNRRLI